MSHLINCLLAAAGEASINSALGRWRQAISMAVREIEVVVEALPPVVNGYIENDAGVTTTSAALVDITGVTFDLVLPVASRIFATMDIQTSTTGGSPATGAWAISINSVDGTELQRFLSGTNDTGIVCVMTRSAILAAGTYTVKGRHRRVSGSSTLSSDVVQLAAQEVRS